MTDYLEKPTGFPLDRWKELTMYQKVFWLNRVEKYGSYELAQENINNWAKNVTRLKKVSDEDIEAIRQSTESNSTLANRYGVTTSFISKVRNNHRR
jgi:hypothetical protein